MAISEAVITDVILRPFCRIGSPGFDLTLASSAANNRFPVRSNMRSAVMGIVQEFKEFAVRGNAVDLAVGVIVGAAFGK
ncbi:MAG: MscL family protein, partial [Betaproteobacteria bacterium]|nr:MscL family protein [Betaproteobacteria bacterium]